MTDKTERYVNEIKAACTSEAELVCLTQLIRYLEASGAGAASADEKMCREDDDLEAKYLLAAAAAAAASSSSAKHPTLVPIESVFPVKEDLLDFVVYVFLRRYGWSETIASETVHRMKRTGRAASIESELKAPINSVLDEYLSWMSAQRISLAMLHAYIFALDRASGHHLVRKLLVTHTMTWLTRHFSEMDVSLFDQAKHLVVAGLGDCWSAVRSACAGKLGRLLDRFQLEQLESFFMSIVTICRDPGASWQAQEGAAMAVGVVIRRFHLTVESSSRKTPVASASPVDPALQSSMHPLKFGKDQLLSRLPGFISGNIFDVAYRLLRHEQLSIREFGIKALSSYLMCCDFEEAVRTLDDVVIQIRRGCGINDKGIDEVEEAAATVKQDCVPQTASLPQYSTTNMTVWVDAYAAEGWLGVCVFLVKHLPSNLLMPRWQIYFATFSLLLMHPASTVRQAASTVFKFIVSRGASDPTVLWLVLHGLSSDSPRFAADDMEDFASQTARRSVVNECDDGSLPSATRGTANRLCSNAGSGCTCSSNCACSRVDNDSTALVAAVATESDVTAANHQQQWQKPMLAWEFSEGRLLTYELVLRFLNKNHWLYVFDVHEAAAATALATPVKALPNLMASASGADIRGRQTRLHARMQVNKVHTYAGATFKASFDSIDAKSNQASSTRRQLLRSTHGCHATQSTSAGHLLSAHSKHEVAAVARRRLQAGSQQSSASLSLAACSLLQAAKALHRRRGSGSCIDQGLASRRATIVDAAATLAADLAVAGGCSPMPAAGSAAGEALTVAASQHNQQEHGRAVQSDGCARGESAPVQCPFSTTFEIMFTQTVDCITSDKWELQRIGGQVLPCLTETIGWYNISLLKELWDRYLARAQPVIDGPDGSSTSSATADGSALCYGACLSLLYMLRYAIKLGQCIDPDKVSKLQQQDDHARRAEVRMITDCIDEQLPRLLPLVTAIMNRARVDRLSAVALQVVALSVSSFEHLGLENTEQCISYVASVISDVAVIVHPDLAVTSTVASDGAEAVQRHSRTFPTNGYLSFCSHDTIKEGSGSSRHVQECSERHLLSEAAPCLLTLAKKFHTSSTCSLWSMLPILAYHACTTTDDNLRKTFADSVNTILSGMALSCQQSYSVQGWQLADDIRSKCVVVLCRQIETIHAEALGVHRVRVALDLLSSVCLSQDRSGYRFLATAISCMCDQWQSTLRVGGSALCSSAAGHLPSKHHGKPVVSVKDLEILSNDIHTGGSCSSTSEPTDDDDSINHGDDDPELASIRHDAIFSETDVASPWCGGTAKHEEPTATTAAGSAVRAKRSSANGRAADDIELSGDDRCSLPLRADDSSSDWDSCDDPDEDPDSGNLFSDCISNVITGLIQLDRRAEVEQELAQLPGREQALVKAALGASSFFSSAELSSASQV